MSFLEHEMCFFFFFFSGDAAVAEIAVVVWSE